MILDSEAFRREERLPTRNEFDAALQVISFCNGFDLSQWTDGILPSEDLEDAVRYCRKHRWNNRP